MSRWDARTEILEGGRTRRVWLLSGREPVPYTDVLERWQGDPTFRTFFNELLGAAEFDAYLWETPPVRAATAHRPFEFVQVDCPQLGEMSPQPDAFASHFGDADGDVAAFENLGGDAHLVAPVSKGWSYSHLAAFVHSAPDDVKHALWRRVGLEVAARLSDQPLWLSTSGLGIGWLHVRLDSRPKYYSFTPYREAR